MVDGANSFFKSIARPIFDNPFLNWSRIGSCKECQTWLNKAKPSTYNEYQYKYQITKTFVLSQKVPFSEMSVVLNAQVHCEEGNKVFVGLLNKL